MSKCDVSDCERLARVRGYCPMHYKRVRKYGDPVAGQTFKGSIPRFYAEVVLTYEGDECLIWPFSRNEHGRGVTHIKGKTKQVARLVCVDSSGPPPGPNYQAAHSCGNGHLGCVAKRHLSWKTPAENAADRLIHGTHNRGSRNYCAKLDEDKVREIRALKGALLQREIAALFGTDQGSISKIHADKSWIGAFGTR